MKVTKVDVSSYTGINRAPAGGFVTFSDGKAYSFSPRIERVGEKYTAEGYRFFSYRTVQGVSEHFGFNSPKREALLIAYFNSL